MTYWIHGDVTELKPSCLTERNEKSADFLAVCCDQVAINLQSLAVTCNYLQFVAVCCSLLQLLCEKQVEILYEIAPCSRHMENMEHFKKESPHCPANLSTTALFAQPNLVPFQSALLLVLCFGPLGVAFRVPLTAVLEKLLHGHRGEIRFVPLSAWISGLPLAESANNRDLVASSARCRTIDKVNMGLL
jgi:hypothetical protein